MNERELREAWARVKYYARWLQNYRARRIRWKRAIVRACAGAKLLRAIDAYGPSERRRALAWLAKVPR